MLLLIEHLHASLVRLLYCTLAHRVLEDLLPLLATCSHELTIRSLHSTLMKVAEYLLLLFEMLFLLAAPLLHAVHCLIDLDWVKLLVSTHHWVLLQLSLLVIWDVVLVCWLLSTTNVLYLDVNMSIGI